MRSVWSTLVTCLIGTAGALVAGALGVPAAPLVGSAFTVTLSCILGLRASVPPAVQNIGFTLVGIFLGSAVTPTFLAEAMVWPESLAAMALMLAVTTGLSASILVKFFSFSRATALLSVAPGALSYSLALAKGRALPPVAVVQSVRLLTTTLLFPTLIIGMGTKGTAAPEMTSELTAMGYASIGGLLAIAVGVGRLAARVGFPSAYLLSGLMLSGILHGTSDAVGHLPMAPAQAGFIVIGIVVGARCGGITRAELFNYGMAGGSAAAIGLVSTAAAGLVFAGVFEVPFGQIWLAYAPGGLEALSAMALMLGYDPVFVAAHHIFRFVVLLMLLPIFFRVLH